MGIVTSLQLSPENLRGYLLLSTGVMGAWWHVPGILPLRSWVQDDPLRATLGQIVKYCLKRKWKIIYRNNISTFKIFI